MGNFAIWHWMFVLLVLIGIVGFVIPGWQIARKAGFPGVLLLLLLVPVVNVVVVRVFAFVRWPVETRRVP